MPSGICPEHAQRLLTKKELADRGRLGSPSGGVRRSRALTTCRQVPTCRHSGWFVRPSVASRERHVGPLNFGNSTDPRSGRFCGTFCSGGQEGAVAPVCREEAAARAANWAAAGRPSCPSAPRRGRVFLMGMRALPPRGAGAASTAVPPHRDRGQRGTPRGAGATMLWRTLPGRLPRAGPCAVFALWRTAAWAALPSRGLCAGTPWRWLAGVRHRLAAGVARSAGRRTARGWPVGSTARAPLALAGGRVPPPPAPPRALTPLPRLVQPRALRAGPPGAGGVVAGPPVRPGGPRRGVCAAGTPPTRAPPCACPLWGQGPPENCSPSARSRRHPRWSEGESLRQSTSNKMCDKTHWFESLCAGPWKRGLELG